MATIIKDPNVNTMPANAQTTEYGGYSPWDSKYVGGGTDNKANQFMKDTQQIFDPIGLFWDAPNTITRFPGVNKLQPSQQSLLDQLTTYYSQYASGKPLPSYDYPQVAGLSSGEQKASNIYDTLRPNDYTPLLQSLWGLASGNPQYYEESYRKNVEEPTVENWITKLMPELKSQFAKKGLLYGSGREVAERESLEGLLGELTKGRVGLASNLEQMKTTAVPLLANIMGLPMAEAERIAAGLSTTGATGRGIEQKALDTRYANWLRQQPGTRPTDELLLKILGIQPITEDQLVTQQGKTGMCIIVTLCTSRDSEEVNITREYRDKYLSVEQLRGYYVIAEKVVPFLKYSIIKKITKRLLVDKLISHAKGKHNLTTKLFLKLCEYCGQRPSFVRSNGEIV